MITIPKFNVSVGPEEAANIRGWDVIINVNDAPPRVLDPAPAKLFWYPINEVAPWGFGPFYFTKRLLDHYAQKFNVLVHCAAGAHRSPLMVYGWLRSKGLESRQADNLLKGDYTADWERDIKDGTIPADIMEFYALMNARRTWSIMGILNDMVRRKGLTDPNDIKTFIRRH
jgi:hypothetical protein